VDSHRLISVDHGTGRVLYVSASQQQRIVSSARFIWAALFSDRDRNSGGAYKEATVEYQHHVYSTLTASSMDNGPVTISAFLPLQ
jgi:hypothetical protein